MIVQGNGIARVTGTGINTEIGKIGKALEGVKEEPTRLKTGNGIAGEKNYDYRCYTLCFGNCWLHSYPWKSGQMDSWQE